MHTTSLPLRALLAVMLCATVVACSKSAPEKDAPKAPKEAAKKTATKKKATPKKKSKNALPPKAKPAPSAKDLANAKASKKAPTAPKAPAKPPEPKTPKAPIEPVAKALAAPPKPAPKPPAPKPAKRRTYKPSQLVVVTNFEKAQITVNGRAYPEQVNPDEPGGMVLPAGGPYTVVVGYDGKQRTYDLSLRPYETRYLVVELSGYEGAKGAVSVAPPKPTPPPEKVEEKEEEDKKGKGRVTVYAKPRGTIIVDGKDTGRKAPNTITPGNGRHEIQVRYEDGELSEVKNTRVRDTSRIKMFFRQKKNKTVTNPVTSRKPTVIKK